MKASLHFGFVLLWILSACAPATPTASTVSPTLAVEAATPPPVQTNTAAPPLPVAATSRGEELEASDPAQVAIGEGKPVLLEFFRFT